MGMKADNPFDRALDIRKSIPSDVREESVWVVDTLDLCWDAARTVFEDMATPAIALAIFDRVAVRVERRQNALRDGGAAGAAEDE